MAVPTSLSDLSTTASSNPPSGATSIGSEGIDDHFRAGYAFIAQLNANKVASASPTFTGTVTIPTPFTLGTVSVTATGTELNYVNGVTSAIQTQLNAKAPLASPTFTGTVALPATWSIGGVTVLPTGTELNYVDGVTSAIQTQLNAKAPTASPTFTGTVSGITATMVGLANVTNESKATMFTSPTFTGTATLPTTAFGNSAITGMKSAAFNGEYNAGTGTSLTPDFANGQKQYCTLGASTTTITLNTGSFPGVGHYQLRIIQPATAVSVTWAGTAYSAGRWLNDADANDINSANNGETIISIYWNGTGVYLSAGKVGAA